MLGLSLNLSEIAGRSRGAVPPFDPLSLSPIALFDPSQSGSLFQDAAQTVAVSASGDPVGFVSDQGLGGHSLLQGAAERRPLYDKANGLHWINGDGVDDMLIAASVPLPPTVTFCIGAEVNSVSSNSDALISIESADGDFQLDAGSPSGFEARFNSSGLGVGSIRSPSAHMGAKVYALMLDQAAATITLRVNGVQNWQVSGYNGALASAPALHLLTNRSTGSRIGAKLFAASIWGDVNLSRVQEMEAWTAARSGVTL